MLALFHVTQIIVLARGSTSSNVTKCFSSDAAFWAPFMEEFLYRFALFNIALQRSGGNVLFAAATSSLIFAAVHLRILWEQPTTLLTVLSICIAAISGITYTGIYAVTGSLLGPLLLHVLNNVAALIYAGSSDGDSTCMPEINERLVASLSIQGCLYVAGSYLAYKSVDRHAKVAASRWHLMQDTQQPPQLQHSD